MTPDFVALVQRALAAEAAARQQLAGDAPTSLTPRLVTQHRARVARRTDVLGPCSAGEVGDY